MALWLMGWLPQSCTEQVHVAIHPEAQNAQLLKCTANLGTMKIQVRKKCINHSLTDPNTHQWPSGQTTLRVISVGSATIRQTSLKLPTPDPISTKYDSQSGAPKTQAGESLNKGVLSCFQTGKLFYNITQKYCVLL